MHTYPATMLGAYVGGYYALGEYDELSDDDGMPEDIWRDYQQQWLATLYRPAGKLEAWLRGIGVNITGPEDGML